MENRKSVGQRAGPPPGDVRRLAVAEFIAAHAGLLAQQGAVVAAWRRRNGRRIGPYYSLVYRELSGRQCSVYLGAVSDLVEAVRRQIAELQAPLRLKRQLAGIRRALRREFVAAQEQLDVELAQIGLSRKGSEIRGWSRTPRRLPSNHDRVFAAAIGDSADQTVPN